jgi:hypothetical protein
MADNKNIGIKNLPQVGEIKEGDFLLVEAEAGTSILDFKDFVIGDDNTTQAAQVSSLQTDVDGLSSTIDTLSADIIRDGDVSTIYAYGHLSAVGASANYIVPFSTGHNNGTQLNNTTDNSNKITILSGGVYVIHVEQLIQPNSAYNYLNIQIDGSAVAHSYNPSNTTSLHHITQVMRRIEKDSFIDFKVSNATSDSWGAGKAPAHSSWSIHRISTL